MTENWEQAPFHTLFRRIPKRTGYGDKELLSVYRDYGVIIKSDRDDNFNRPGESLDDYQLVKLGDLVLNKMKTWQGSLGISAYEGIVSPAYFVYEPQGEFDSRYMHYLLRSQPSIDYYGAHSKGVRVNQWDLQPEYLDKMKVRFPPLEYQQRIADYLDRETAEIDAAVADLDRYVELLEKRRRVIIVDGFNDPVYNPVMQRLKFLTVSEDHRRIPIKSGDRVDMAGKYPYYGASGIIDYVNDYLWDGEKRLILSEDGANLVMRNHPVAFVADGQYWVNNHAHVLRCADGIPPELVAMAIEVTSIAHLITGSAQPKLTAAAMGEVEFMFPLSTADQRALLETLRPEMHEIDSLIAESTRLRDLLLKRRSVLITEVVTGRKQV
ncbi:restriction endonuclease subunit S [Corynebacterium casei]|uniref:restriction endonuclease subunit S n=1 Tax=Corynebacterium casei TaxID=160386 RepID=UPI003FD4C080